MSASEHGVAIRSTSDVLRSIFDSPELARSVSELDATSLGMLVSKVGLEDSAELLGMMRSEQISDLLDDDLWSTTDSSTQAELDPARFALWLELLLEAGEETLVQHLRALDEDFVVFALHQSLIVISLDELALTVGARSPDDMKRIESALDQRPTEDLGEYLVVARRDEGWDALWAVLLALDERDHELLARLLDRCAHLCLDEVAEADDGLFEVLTRHEMAAADVAEARDDRRKRRGFVSKEDAVRHLAEIDRTSIETLREQPLRGPFEGYKNHLEAPPPVRPSRLAELLRAAGVMGVAGARRLPDSTETLGFENVMRDLKDAEPERYVAFAEEMIFVANVLLGADDALRPADAARAALEAIEAGFEEIGKDAYDGESPLQLFQVGRRVRGREP